LAVIIAFLLWFYVVSQKSVQYTFIAPIKFQNLPENLIIDPESANIKSVKIVAQGPRSNISNSANLNIEVPLNISAAQIGENKFRIYSTNINIPDGFKIVEISPDEVNIKIDVKTQKYVPIIPELSGDPADNFEIETTIVKPTRLLVKSSASVLKNLNELKTEIININGLAKSLTVESVINVNSKLIQLPEGNKTSVNIIISEKRIEKKLLDVKTEIIGEKSEDLNYKVVPENVSVVIKGPKGLIDNFDSRNLKAKLYLKSKNENQKIKPVFDLPDKIEIISINPPLISIEATGAKKPE